jgi:hypothetical protein
MGLCFTDDVLKRFPFLKRQIIFHKRILRDRFSDHLADEVN